MIGRPDTRYSSSFVEKTVRTSSDEQFLWDSGAIRILTRDCRACTSGRDRYLICSRLVEIPISRRLAILDGVQKIISYSGGRSSAAEARVFSASRFIGGLTVPTNKTVGFEVWEVRMPDGADRRS